MCVGGLTSPGHSVPGPRHRVTALTTTTTTMDIKDKNEFIYFMQVRLLKPFPSSPDLDPSAPAKTSTMTATSNSTTSFSGDRHTTSSDHSFSQSLLQGSFSTCLVENNMGLLSPAFYLCFDLRAFVSADCDFDGQVSL